MILPNIPNCIELREGSLLKETLAREKHIHCIATPRNNQKGLPPADSWFLKHFRKTMETFFSQLTNYFHANVVKAKTLWGLITNLYTKITAYTLGVYLSETMAANLRIELAQRALHERNYLNQADTQKAEF